MVFKIMYTPTYGHVYCTLFVAPAPNQTWANCGKVVVRRDEFEDMQRCMSGVAFVERPELR